MGKRHSFYFLPWHFNFFCRYRPLPEETFGPMSQVSRSSMGGWGGHIEVEYLRGMSG